MNRYEPKKIMKEEFYKLGEDNVIFITNPGRMGDEDGSTFVIKTDNELTIYRVDGWMYPNEKNSDFISMEEMVNHFPKWIDAWKNGYKEGYNGKYRYLYLGFGNGLCIDNSIYKEFEPYLNELVEEYLAANNNAEKEEYRNVAIYYVWINALIKMAEDKNIKIN